MIPAVRLFESLTVSDVAVPIVGIRPPDCTVEEAREWLAESIDPLEDQLGRFAVVEEDGGATGWFGMEHCLGDGTTVGDVADPLSVSQMLSSDTPVSDLIAAFASHPPCVLFVLTGRSISHSVCYQDLVDAPPFKAALFGLFLELEADIMELVFFDADMLVASVDGRKQKQAAGRLGKARRARRRGDDAQREPSAVELLPYLDLSDKLTMLKAMPGPHWRRSLDEQLDVDSFLCRARDIRNELAHGRPLVDCIDREELPELVNTVRHLLEVIGP